MKYAGICLMVLGGSWVLLGIHHLLKADINWQSSLSALSAVAAGVGICGIGGLLWQRSTKAPAEEMSAKRETEDQMSTSHIKSVALVLAIQAICLAGVVRWDKTDMDWLAGVFFFCTYSIPFIGYIAVLYKAPVFEGLSCVLKIVCLTVLSFFATVAGTMVIFVSFAIAGFPFRGRV